MSEFVNEKKELFYNPNEILNLRLTCKNYKITICESSTEQIILKFRNTNLRKLIVTKRGNSLIIEEKLKLTFYGVFRLIALAFNNELVIEIPSSYKLLNVNIETTSLDVRVENLNFQSLKISSIGGETKLYNIYVDNSLYITSESGKIDCVLSGNEEDYDVKGKKDTGTNETSSLLPDFYSHPESKRKVYLISKAYLPNISFIHNAR